MLFKHILKISKYFLFPIFVFVFDVVALIYLDIYDIIPWFDVPMHFLGGVAIGFMFFFILKYFENEKMIKINPFFNALFIISLVSLIAILWEFAEFSLAFIFSVIHKGSIEDTLLDLTLGIMGGMVAVILLEIKKF
jgi:hypothetical protein|tara:strand:- start:10549 stop:10956 length:408 start_codon:yes stop_codon:yes gene_type:complete